MYPGPYVGQFATNKLKIMKKL